MFFYKMKSYSEAVPYYQYPATADSSLTNNKVTFFKV